MENHGLIPDHQFGFRSKHATTKQIHRIVKRMTWKQADAAQRSTSMSCRFSTRFGTEDYFTKSKLDFQLTSMSS